MLIIYFKFMIIIYVSFETAEMEGFFLIFPIVKYLVKNPACIYIDIIIFLKK